MLSGDGVAALLPPLQAVGLEVCATDHVRGKTVAQLVREREKRNKIRKRKSAEIVDLTKRRA